MKTVFVSLIALFMTLPAMARTVGSSDVDLIKQKISERQTNYELKSKSNLNAPAALTLTDTKTAARAQSVNKGSKLNSEGGWQPEINDMTGNTGPVLEAIRLLADQNCSATHIAEGMATLFSQEFAGSTIDISSLSEYAKSCLSR
jgi:hypothetical protein